MQSRASVLGSVMGGVRRHFRLLLGLAISAASLFYLFRSVDFVHLWETFRQANYLYLLPAALLLVAINIARAVRWRLLIGDEPALDLRRLFAIVNIGYLFNNVLPAKAGEVVRAYLVGRVVRGGVGRAASTLVVERLLDVLTLVVLMLVLMPLVTLPAWLRNAGLTFGALAIGGSVALVVLARFGKRGLDWVWRIVGRMPVVGHPKMKEALAGLLEGFRVLTDWRVLGGVAIWSALVWLGYAVFNYVLMLAFRLSLPFSAAATVLCATGFSMVVPSSPGAVGPFEAAAVLALSLFGLPESPASAYAFGLHGFTNITLILYGLVGLRREGLSFSRLRSGALPEADLAGAAGDRAASPKPPAAAGAEAPDA